MSSTTEHYQQHLARIYSWMAGGAEAAISRGQQELAGLGLLHGDIDHAVDLGAGFGMHAIPLARRGCTVLAVDTSAILLAELAAHAGEAPVTTAQDDLLNFPRYLSHQPALVLCMGDTLTHLPDLASVAALFSSVAAHLPRGGRLIITFRDYTRALEGSARFIPVRSDESRIFTCFLEYSEDTVQVHDILHEHEQGSWLLRVSAYRKLRLEPARVKRQLETHGFVVDAGTGLSGMIRMTATLA